MTIRITMLVPRRSEDGLSILTPAGSPYPVGVDFARAMVGNGFATDTDSALPRALPGSLSAVQLAAALAGLAGLPSLTCTRIGDSITTRDNPTVASGLNGPRADGMGFLGYMVSAGRVRTTSVRATAGFTIAQIAATHLADALLDPTNIIDCLAGTNDCLAPTPDDASVIFARLRDQLWLPVLNSGKVLRAYTIPPCGTATSIQRIAKEGVNKLIREAASTYPTMLLVDLDNLWQSADGSNGGAATNYYDPGDATKTHPQDTGSLVAAAEAWRKLQQRGISGLSGSTLSLASPYSLATNPRGAGANATASNRTVLNAGVTGTGPHGWQFSRSGSAAAVITPGAVQRADGRDGQLVQVAFTGGAAGDGITIEPAFSGVMRLTGATSEDTRQNTKLYAPGEVRRFSNGLFYKSLALGTTAGAEPGSLPTTIGGLVTDGTVTWMKVPEIVAGLWVRTVAEFIVTAHATERLWAQALMRQQSSSQGNLGAAVTFSHNGALYTAGNTAATFASIVAPAVTGNNGFYPGSVPLNQLLRVESPWAQIASDCGMLNPALRLFGGAAVAATVQVAHIDLQLYAGSAAWPL